LEPTTATLANGTRFEDRYEILGELGSGSFGRVYQARQLSTGQSVAIKLLSAREGSDESTGREVERFRRETRICADLSHTNIVGLIDSGETQDGQLYAVFAYVSGETLEQALSRDGALSVRESVRLMMQVLEALEYAHAKGIVHRDLKPSNFMLSGTAPRRNAVVLDFGLGGLAEGRRRKEWQTLTQTREFLGTPLYAAPEQLAGETPTERTDLYAWGLIFLECLTGRHPFAEEGAAARLFGGYGGAVEIPEWLRGHRLGELLEAVTTGDAAKRDVSIETLIEALDQIAGGGELPEAPEEAPTAAPLAERGERRHLTVMFCDLVGSSALGQRLDTEAYRRVVQAYHSRATEAIERYEGHVGQYLGDGLLVYFGYPQAHEDDAERAVRAGREMLRELASLNPRLEAEHGVHLQARVGIHTGLAVVGEIGGSGKPQTMALGDTLNVAARLEAFAEPDTVVISDATLRLVAGLFVTEDRGTPELKGISEPIQVHRVIQPSGVSSRLDRAPTLTPFVGREQELGLLLDRFEQTQERRAQAVLIAGEAGIGKSRLVHRLRERLVGTPHTWLECRSSPYTQNSALSRAAGAGARGGGPGAGRRRAAPRLAAVAATARALRAAGDQPPAPAPEDARGAAFVGAGARREAAGGAGGRGPALGGPLDARVAGALDRAVRHRGRAPASDLPPGLRAALADARAPAADGVGPSQPPPGEGLGRGGGGRGAARRSGRSARRAVRRHPALRGGAGEGRRRVGPRSHRLALRPGDPRDAPGLADGAARPAG
jgi:class 3 adenylate cyclase